MNEPDPPSAPEAWPRAQALTRSLWSPIERFLHIEAASGLLLMAAAAIGLAWANSPWAHSYEALWHAKLTLGIGPLVFSQTLHFVINEGLMALFFFLVGLEIRREMHDGELASVKQATLPIGAALGGMLLPALIYLVVSGAGPAQRGFGVPMATDIAFAVGVLSLLGRRVPPALRVLLLSLAIIDDIGAILVIAVFYSSGISVAGMAVAAAGVVCVIAFQRFGVRRATAYLAPGVVVWVGLLQAGVHPTLTGVLVGLMTPVRAWFGAEGFTSATTSALAEFEHHAREGARDPKRLLGPLERMHTAHREALSPVVRLETALHPWVAFVIMPLFALANAGVNLGGVDLTAGASRSVVWGVGLGLCIGKPIGVMLACYALVKLGAAALPSGVGWSGVLLVGLLAGIGFTMAIFIAGLAFSDAGLLAAAKLAVLLASAGAALLGLGVGFGLLGRSSGGAPKSAHD